MARSYGMFLALLALLFLPVCGTDFVYDDIGKKKQQIIPGPGGVTASDGTHMGSVVISWSSVSNAVSYNVYRSDVTNGAFQLVGTNLTVTTFEDTSVEGTGLYYYRVSFHDHLSNESSMSAHNAGYAALYKPAAVAGLRVSSTLYPDKVVLDWNSATDAVSYTVYRSSSEKGPYTAITNGLTALTYSDANLTFGATYYYRVVYNDVKNRSSILSDAVTGTTAFSATALPSGLTASAGSYGDKIALSWIPAVGATAYRVYRSTSADGGYQQVGGDIVSTSYEDSSITKNRLYYYRLSAVQGGGIETAFTAASSGFAWGTKPAIVASDGNHTNYVQLGWSQEPWVASYRVFRSTSAGGSYTMIASGVNDTNYQDSSAVTGTHYFYKVAAVSSNGVQGPMSECDEGYRRFQDAPEMPANVQGGTKTVLSVKVTWNAVAGAYRYRVYWCDTIDGVYSVAEDSASSTSYTKSLTINQKFFRVCAYNSAGHEGPLSPPADAYSDTHPCTPNNVQATDGTQAGKVTVSWDLAYSPLSTKCRVYRADAAGGPFVDISGSVSGSSYEDTTVKKGTYYYKVSSETGLYSASASYVDAGSPLSVPILSAPASLTASDGTDASAVAVRWQSVADAAYYKLFRANSESGPYRVISGQISDASAGYDDTNLQPGTTCYYKVAAYNSADEMGAMSSADSGFLKTASVEPPSLVLASDGSLENKISVIWTPVPGAAYYRVYRAEKVDGVYLSVGSKVSVPTTVYEDTAVAAISYYYKVAAFDSQGRMSGLSASDVGTPKPVPVPDTPSDIIATDGTYTNKVSVTWTPADGAAYYKLARASHPDGPYNYISGKIYSTGFEDTSVPAGAFYYKVSAYNDENRTGALSKYDIGHIKLTDLAFFMEYEKTIARSHQKLTLMHKGGTSALGKEFKSGDINGQVLYDAHTKGIGGEVFITYNQYCDYYMVLNGKQTTLANMSENGTMTGRVDVTSVVYNGYVRYQMEIHSGAADGGYWYVSQDGKPETTIPWFAH